MIGMTVCSRIGAPELSAPWIDWQWQSEIERFPSDVLAKRFPQAINLGDMTKYKEWPDAKIDVLCGGTPCQSFSIAGLRKGLADPRGNLMLTYLAIAARYRPEWLVWENVTGVLSSGGGRDFGAFLGGLAELGYHAAWRVLDAQFCRTRIFPRAVPQRRRRVFLVGHLGDWRRAAAVLFDGESLRGNPPPSREKGEAAAAAVGESTEGSGEWPADVSPSMNAHYGDKYGLEDQHALNGAGMFVPCAFDCKAGGKTSFSVGDIPGSLRGDGHGGGHVAVSDCSCVRRLTPTECERLMGFPDGWTAIEWRGKSEDKCPDGPRYKALGNSWAVNCGQYLFDRMKMVAEQW